MHSNFRRLAVGLLLCAFPATLTGCLDFEKETMVFVFPRNVPEVRALLIYEGIGVSGTGEGDLKKAREQFTRLVSHQQEFCLGGNWIGHFLFVPEPDDKEAERIRKNFMRNHIVVENGALFRNAQGKVCGYQTLTIRDGAKFVRELNDFVSVGMAEFASDTAENPEHASRLFDNDSLRMIKKAAENKFQWFELDPGRLSFSLPATPATVRRMKHGLFVEPLTKLQKHVAAFRAPPAGEADKRTPEQRADELRERLEDVVDLAKFFEETPFGFDHGHDRVTFTFGLGNGEPMTLTTQGSKSLKHEKEILQWAKSLQVPFRDEVDAEKLIEQFKENRGFPKPP
jgi:hypothetical protein